MSLCASCTKFSVNAPVRSSEKKTPEWLHEVNYVQEFINKKNFANRKPAGSDQVIKLSMGKNNKNRKVLYWAAKKSSSLLVTDAKSAYDKFQNHGITQLDDKGNTTIHIQSPRIYKTVAKGKKKPESYYSHFHVVVSNKEINEWESNNIYTQVVVCKRDLKYVQQCLKSSSAIVLNALPCEFYGHDHIPNSYNLTAKQVKKFSARELGEWLFSLCDLHYPNISKNLHAGKILINEVPIICYCANSRCTASAQLEMELLHKGCLRVESFPGGMKEYRQSA